MALPVSPPAGSFKLNNQRFGISEILMIFLPVTTNLYRRITRDLLTEMERMLEGLLDMSESAKELSRFEQFAENPKENAVLVNTLFQGGPVLPGQETLPLKVAWQFQELGAQGTEF
jgi:hypothetical protein